MAEEWRVEIELRDEGHGLSLGEKLRTVDLDDEARERLGGGAIVTRDGSTMFVYVGSEAAATEAAGVISELVRADELEADVKVTRWDSGDHAWEDIHASAREHAAGESDPDDERPGVPFLVFLEAHKPRIMRDLGL
jgi:hypothetical protein